MVTTTVTKLQTELEASLKRMNRGREKIRQVYLAEEKARREAEQAALKAAEEEVSIIKMILPYAKPPQWPQTVDKREKLIAFSEILIPPPPP